MTTPLEQLHDDLLPPLVTLLKPKGAFRLSAVSSTLYGKTLSLIAADSSLLSDFCSKVLLCQNEESVQAALEAVAQFKKEDRKICIRLNCSDIWYGTEATLEKIERLFGGIYSLAFTDATSSFDPIIPLSVQELILRNPQQCPVALFERNNETLRSLKVLGPLTKDQFKQVIYFPYSTDFEYLYLDHKFPECNWEQVERYAEQTHNGVAFWFCAIHDLESGRQEKGVKLLQQCLQLSPRFIPAKVLLGESIEEAVSARPTEAHLHFLLGKRLVHDEPKRASSHLEQARTLAIKERDVRLLLNLAAFLKSKEVSNQAYECLDRADASAISYLEQIVGLDPTHIRASFELANHFAIQRRKGDAKACLQSILPVCVERQDIAALIYLCSIDDPDVAGGAFEALKKGSIVDPKRLRDYYETDWKYFTDIILSHNISIDVLLRPWIDSKRTSCIVDIFSYILARELNGGPLQALTYTFTQAPSELKSDLRVLYCIHRLEGAVRAKSETLERKVCKVFTYGFSAEQLWLVFHFLQLRALFPEQQIQILERIVQQTEPFSRNKWTDDFIKMAQIDQASSGITSLFPHPKDQSYFKNPPDCFIPLNARIILAVAMLPKDRARATALFSKLIPRLFVIDDPMILERFVTFFEENDLLPEARKQFLKKIISKSPKPEYKRQLAVLLLRGKGIVVQDDKAVHELLDEDEIEELRKSIEKLAV